MILPLRTDRPIRINPYINWGLIVLNLAVFIIQLKVPTLVDRLALDPYEPKLYQFFTYAFLHGGVGHLFGNMLFLYIFGNNVNDRFGNAAYLAFYLGGAVFAGVTHRFFVPDAPVIGASGAVSAVTGAFMILLPMTRVTLLIFFFIIGVYEISSVWFILAFFLMDLGQQFIPFLGGGNTAYGAHLGGTVFGALLSMGLLATRLLPRDLFDALALLDRWNRRRQWRDLASKGYDPFAPTPALAGAGVGRARPDPKFDQIQDLRATINEAIAHDRLSDAATAYGHLMAVDPTQVMSRTVQLDIANELFSRQDYNRAAVAYEAYLKQYSRGGESIEHIQLMLGLIYARYVPQPARAKELLTAAVGRLQSGREQQLAREELAKLP